MWLQWTPQIKRPKSMGASKKGENIKKGSNPYLKGKGQLLK